jgi:predicted kinase
MRKWMRDRLKRKKPEAGKSGPAPAPLQPAYFDAAPDGSTPPPVTHAETEEPVANHGHDSVEDSAIEPVEAPASRSPQTPREGGAADPRRRRRRGRGGRGRSGSRQGTAVSQAGNQPETLPEAGAEGHGQERGMLAPAKSSATGAPAVSKGSVILAIGLPGSGKSSWFKRHKVTPLSSDMLRSLLFDDPTEQRFQDLIFSNLRSMLKARLIARRPLNYVDATNLTPHERQSWIKLGHDYGYDVQAVFFDVPLEVCLERNKKRERVVAEDVMRRMSAKLKAPTFEEGFSKITVVRVKLKETE